MKEITLRSSWMLFSQLLQYPDATWQETSDDMYVDWCHLIQEENEEVRDTLQTLAGECIASFAGMDAEAITSAYVKTFDFNKKSNLYLTYGQLGEDRERGPALLRLKQLYEEEDMIMDTDELPDFLPLVLEYVAVAEMDRGIGLLVSFRKALEQLQSALDKQNSPYRYVMEAILWILDHSGITEGLIEISAPAACGSMPSAQGCGPMWAAAGYGQVKEGTS
ncbi:putative nitrate reductase molybdenum cofactor assembly chaperone NarJ [Paenibacillus sp. J45TS6]|uniref:nitrate reductase molybdenum cofactor assembly chaperone n=1 Tax=Paenibacillus sp. J45TS6 TaxID=2807196 RepID=UPI001B0089DB|nr:nitrate reductase molybdenum cofactor assembly chaperone [Paenibacillus sp. J45TS6]GIP44425.1 putative nitrate reductase molybdenum cofactor assembly chaperone NarJ [Paenibacillus sp. J45TS6]